MDEPRHYIPNRLTSRSQENVNGKVSFRHLNIAYARALISS
jgi:hypothetical protein